MIVRGRVQGVGFRYFVYRAAQEKGLAGFAENREDGSVLVEAEGPLAEIESLAKEIAQGPPAARVQEVVRTEIPEMGDSYFRVA